MYQLFFSLLAVLLLCTACNESPKTSTPDAPTADAVIDTLRYDTETNLRNLRQLTFGGDNAEAYFSFDDQRLVFQASNENWGAECDQIFTMPIEGYRGEMPKRLSTGKGRTTCSYFMPGDTSILYASTHLVGDDCPEAPRSVNGKYVWAIHPGYDIFEADMDGNIIRQITDSPGYDAEATLSPDGSKMVFTSTRSGDLELYVMNTDGTDLVQVTDELGYDGGAFFSPDGEWLVWRSSRPSTPEAQKTYRDFLAKDLVQPTNMEIYVGRIDGTEIQKVTDLGGANWAPYFHPSGEKILFSTNHHGSGRQFNIFSINLDGSDLRQVTFDPTFDAFPMFSYDGKKLVFSSNRYNGGTRSTNVFLADWVEE